MKTIAKMANSFAHLAGLGRGKAAKAEDDEKKERDHEDVDDGAKKGKKAEDDEPEKKDDDKKDSDAKAEDDDPDAKASGDDQPSSGDEDDDGDKKGKKAKKASDEDEDDEKMRAGAVKERARCAAIFGSPAAARNVQMAAKLAFSTDLTAAQAIEVLQTAPAATAHPNRAASNPRVGATGAPELTGKQAVDSSWDRAFAQVTPQKRK